MIKKYLNFKAWGLMQYEIASLVQVGAQLYFRKKHQHVHINILPLKMYKLFISERSINTYK